MPELPRIGSRAARKAAIRARRENPEATIVTVDEFDAKVTEALQAILDVPGVTPSIAIAYMLQPVANNFEGAEKERAVWLIAKMVAESFAGNFGVEADPEIEGVRQLTYSRGVADPRLN